MIFILIALCALIGIVSAAGGGTGTGVSTALFNENPLDVVPFFDGEEEVVVDDEVVEVVAEEECAEGDEECEAAKVAVVEPANISVDDQLLTAAGTLSENWSDAEITDVMTGLFKNVDGAVMVYVIDDRGVIKAVYPDKFDAAVGDFVGRLPVGGILLKARELTETAEYTSPRDKITGYDIIHPIMKKGGEYLGAVVVKIAS
ncbi:MAG: hypothetical protein LBV40_01675 [Methanomicrobiales archaeon]|nr:hypothetical protein [Methanomicrobiales archaeon]